MVELTSYEPLNIWSDYFYILEATRVVARPISET